TFARRSGPRDSQRVRSGGARNRSHALERDFPTRAARSRETSTVLAASFGGSRFRVSQRRVWGWTNHSADGAVNNLQPWRCAGFVGKLQRPTFFPALFDFGYGLGV